MTRTLALCATLFGLGAVVGYLLARPAVGPLTGAGAEVKLVPPAIAAVEGPARASEQPRPLAPPPTQRTTPTTPTTLDAALPDGATTAVVSPASRPAPAPGPIVDRRAGCPDHLFTAPGRLVAGGDPFLEQRMQWLLEDYDVPAGAVAVVEPVSGRLLAAAGYREGVGEDRGLTLAPDHTAASIFKIVSAIALLESGLKIDDTICYNGGKRRIHERQLEDDPGRDGRCADFTTALGRSLNIPFAKWADRRLDRGRLRGAAERFGFRTGDDDGGACFGQILIPDDRLSFARTAAGFGEVTLSAWHGALIGALVANRGVWPSSLDGVAGRQGRLLSSALADQLATMMVHTVDEGTARRAFRERGHFALGRINVAGKTGSLTEGEGEAWRDVTWFVGFAPVEAPTVSVAAMIVNKPAWRIRASYVGREALRTALLRTSPYRPTQDRIAVASVPPAGDTP
ncbi:MAG: penicillin-binding protein [Deltaproteobacteria bacterium]|nr:penicillin-binding protein [Deltaproteobacteria bacterium]